MLLEGDFAHMAILSWRWHIIHVMGAAEPMEFVSHAEQPRTLGELEGAMAKAARAVGLSSEQLILLPTTPFGPTGKTYFLIVSCFVCLISLVKLCLMLS